jgi:tetratricopeptide (TPR) repeat protein
MGYYQLGRALLNENKIPEAKGSAELARSLGPNNPIIYRLLSNIHVREKDYPALLQDLNACIQLDPDSPAGRCAKQLREEVQQKIAAEKPIPAASPYP